MWIIIPFAGVYEMSHELRFDLESCRKVSQSAAVRFRLIALDPWAVTAACAASPF
jgi:hypothetical protein